MILRPVNPQSPIGPPITNLPVGFTRYRVPCSISFGKTSYCKVGRVDILQPSFAAHERFNSYSDRLRRSTLKVMRVWSVYNPSMSFAGAMGTVLVLWYGGRQVLEGVLKPGEFFLFNEKLLHHSEPNRSNRRRLGMSVRLTIPIVRIQHDILPLHPGHAAILARGEDYMGWTRLMPRPTSG